MTSSQMRKLALSLPGAVESSHFGKADFRVNDKIFAGLAADDLRANLKLTLQTQEVVTSAEPDTYLPATGAWGRAGWTYVVLRGTTPARLKSLLEEAHELVSGGSTKAKRRP